MILIAGTLSPIFIPILLSTENGGSPQKLTETFSVVTTFVLLFLIVDRQRRHANSTHLAGASVSRL